MGARWTIEQVVAAEPMATTARWSSLGCDDRAAWGRCRGSGSEPYETMVDHAQVAWRCTCPSRKSPCKHAVALLLLWVRGDVLDSARPADVAGWVTARDRRADSAPTSGRESANDTGSAHGNSAAGDRPDGDDADGVDMPDAPDRDTLDRARDERIARMRAGLVELDRWLEDRMRTGLADPALARYATWDALAARLVDARAGALANRVRRLAGLVGASPDWHSDVLAELGLLHLIAEAGQRVGALPSTLADAVATASGWQVRQADVLAGVPETDEWAVMGRSDTREDRIEVRRTWLRGVASGKWAMLLSFAAYQQVLDDTWTVGTVVRADLHRYPGGSLRALTGERFADAMPVFRVPAVSIAEACSFVGACVAVEPWTERVAVTVSAAASTSDRRWVLTDTTGSLPLVGDARSVAMLLAATDGAPATITVEWTPRGLVPLTVHLDDRPLDVGPRADPTFVGAA